MKKLGGWLAMFALIAACSTAFAGDDKSDKAVGNLGHPGVLPPQSMAFGKSYGEWSKEWWLYTMPKELDVNPFAYGTDGTIGSTSDPGTNVARDTGNKLYFSPFKPSADGMVNYLHYEEFSCLAPIQAGIYDDGGQLLSSCSAQPLENVSRGAWKCWR